jgi:hypothetical protein
MNQRGHKIMQQCYRPQPSFKMNLIKVHKQSITCKFKKRVRFADTSTLIVTVGKTTKENKASWCVPLLQMIVI